MKREIQCAPQSLVSCRCASDRNELAGLMTSIVFSVGSVPEVIMGISRGASRRSMLKSEVVDMFALSKGDLILRL
jgi:hypothetical protein